MLLILNEVFTLFFLVQQDSPQRDIVFLVDGSDETLSGFPYIKSFIKQVVETLNVGENGDQISVVQYSSDPQMHFSFNTYSDLQDILTTVEQLKHKGGGPLNTGAALEYVRTNTFAESSGSRHKEGVPQILILLSGGASQDEVKRVAAALKQDQVVAFCVGTKNSDLLELQTIAHVPSYTFALRQFENIGQIYHQLVSFVKRVPRQTGSKPPTVFGKLITYLPTLPRQTVSLFSVASHASTQLASWLLSYLPACRFVFC